MHEDARIIGIDLGTTNSVVAIIEGDEPVVIPNQEGSNKTPSVVAFLDDNECIVGEIARRQAATNPLRTISSIKRIMGMDFEQAEERGGQLPFNIVDHEGKLLIDINGFGYSPEQISALVLKKLKESAEAYLGQEVRQAVITVPANFDDSQRTATMEAARLAGLEVLRLLNEPTAAALAYGIGKSTSEDEVIAVYDFGGGTFDVTILEISDKTFEVLCSTGDTQLGGDDLDNVIVHLIVEEFEEQHGVDLTKDPVTLRRLKEVAEKAKCELSTTSSTMITLPFIAYRNSQPLHLERQISRAEFEELIDSFVTRTIRCCKRAIEDAHISKKDVDKVILVGGSTRIPLVQDAVEDFFGLQPFKGINPDEVVALGAATQAGVFSGNIQEVTLLDVSPHSLGIEVKDGKFSRIIEKNATIPIKAAKNFTTTEEAQTFVNVHILQGESAEASENRSLGKFTLADIPAAPKGSARIRVTFFVNADGVMEISAEELASGAAKTLKIVHSELDEAEKKSRKKARARRGRSTTKGGAPAPTGGGRKLSSPPGQMPQELKKDDSSSVRSNKADSSVRPRTPDNFAVLGDATPGNAPTMPVSPASHKSSEVVPLAHKAPQPQPSTEHIPRPSDSDVRSLPSPRRYGSPGSGLSPIPPESVTNPKTDMHKAATPPMPPADPPRRDDFTSTYESQSSKSDTQEVQMESPDTKEVDLRGLGDLGEDVDWPGVVDSALDYAADNDASEDAKELYAKAIAALSAEPWLTDGRFPVLRARALLLIASGG